MTRNEPDTASPPKRQRIAKAMARAGLCSRRDAEAWIVDGRVSVNGSLLTSPATDVSAEDIVVVDGAPLPTAEKTRLFLFHKPRGLVTSDRDPEGRETVADYLREHWPEGPRVVTIGRLDINTEGLLLLTNDGGLARMLELPQTGWVRRYRVRAKGTANPADLDALAGGLTIDGIDYAGIEAKLDRTQGANCWLTMGLREGKNREIKRVLEHLGLEVNRLIRLSFGPFQLLDLPEGAVEEVRTRVLRDQLGEKLAGQAGVDLGDAAPIVAPPVRDTRPAAREARKGAETRGRPDAGRPRAAPGRTGGPERRVDRDDAPVPIRERPAGGSRKHVSTLRTNEAEDARNGPRKRIERTDTRDRRDRTVTVERLVSARPKRTDSERPRRGGGDDARPRSARPDFEGRGRPARDGATPRRRDASGDAPRGRPPRSDARPARSDARHARSDDPRNEERRPPRREGGGSQERYAGPAGVRRHVSPSAIGKRERMARSGAPRDPSERRNDRRPGAKRDASGFEAGRKMRSSRPEGDTDRRLPRENRRDRSTSDREERHPDKGSVRRPETDRPKRARPAGDRHEGRRDKAPRPGGGGKLGRPMGAASRKPNSRKPSGDVAPRASRPRGSTRAAPAGRKPRGPSPPKS